MWDDTDDHDREVEKNRPWAPEWSSVDRRDFLLTLGLAGAGAAAGCTGTDDEQNNDNQSDDEESQSTVANDSAETYLEAIQQLEELGKNPGEPNPEKWYENSQAQIRRMENAIETLVDQGYHIHANVDDEFVIEIREPSDSPSLAAGVPEEEAMSAFVLDPFTLTVVTVGVGAMITVTTVNVAATYLAPPTAAAAQSAASWAAGAANYLGGQIPSASSALDQLYSSEAYLYLYFSTSMKNPKMRQEANCHIGSDLAGATVDNPELSATAEVIADRTGGCELHVHQIVEHAMGILIDSGEQEGEEETDSETEESEEETDSETEGDEEEEADPGDQDDNESDNDEGTDDSDDTEDPDDSDDDDTDEEEDEDEEDDEEASVESWDMRCYVDNGTLWQELEFTLSESRWISHRENIFIDAETNEEIDTSSYIADPDPDRLEEEDLSDWEFDWNLDDRAEDYDRPVVVAFETTDDRFDPPQKCYEAAIEAYEDEGNPDSSSSITVRVIDSETGEPIPDATVTLMYFEQADDPFGPRATDDDGLVIYEDFDYLEGEYGVRARAAGYAEREQEFTWEDGDSREITLELESEEEVETSILTVTVVDEDTGNPVQTLPNVYVDHDGERVETARANDQGRAQIPVEDGREYTVSAMDEIPRSSEERTVTVDGDTEITLALNDEDGSEKSEPHVLTVNVLTDERDPLHAYVQIEEVDMSEAVIDRDTDFAPTWRFELENGTYTVEVIDPGDVYLPVERTVEIDGGDEEITVELEPSEELPGEDAENESENEDDNETPAEEESETDEDNVDTDE